MPPFATIAHHIHAEASSAPIADDRPGRAGRASEAGWDPASHGGAAKAKRVASQQKRREERTAWEAEHGDGQEERERFVREIQPKLAGVFSRICEATGFSPRYASLIRSGKYVPHPVHYKPLSLLMSFVETV